MPTSVHHFLHDAAVNDDVLYHWSKSRPPLASHFVSATFSYIAEKLDIEVGEENP